MIESIVAISLVLIGLLGIINLIIKSQNTNKEVRSQFVASYLAAEGVEIAKNIIDTNASLNKQKVSGINWNSTMVPGTYEVQYNTTRESKLFDLGGALSSRPLKFDLTTGLYSYDGGVASDFTRTIKITESAPITVDSIVKWRVNGTERAINVSDEFTGWRQ